MIPPDSLSPLTFRDSNGNSLTDGTITTFGNSSLFTITGDPHRQQVLNIAIDGSMITDPLFAVFEFA